MENLNNISEEARMAIAKLNEILPQITGLVGIRGYENKYGEVSNVVVNVGMNYPKAKTQDVETLKQTEISPLATDIISSITLEKARTALIEAFIKPNVNRSKGQTNAYTNVGNGIKVHNVSGDVYVYGYKHSKDVIVEGNYPTVKSRELTIAKNILRKGLKTSKFSNYKIKNADFVKSGNGGFSPMEVA